MSFTIAVISIAFFVAILAIILYLDRRNIERSGILIFRRTDRFLLWIDRVANKFPRFWRFYSFLGIIIFLLSMIILLYFLFRGLINSFSVPYAIPTLAIVLPSISTFKLGPAYVLIPFWYWIISIFLIILVHEISHGIIMRRENFKLKSVGLLLFGIIPGAFVEPEGEKMLPEGKYKSRVKLSGKTWDKGNTMEKLRVLAVGSFANILIGLVFLGSFFLLTANVQGEETIRGSYEYFGVNITKVLNNSPAQKAGLKEGMIITEVNGKEIKGIMDMQREIAKLGPGDKIRVVANGKLFEFRTGNINLSDLNLAYKPSLRDKLMVYLQKNGFNVLEKFRNKNLILEFLRWKWIAEEFPEFKDLAEKNIAGIKDKIKIPRIGIEMRNYKNRKMSENQIQILTIISNFLKFASMLNIGVGIANTIPLKPLDGGHFVEESFRKYFGKRHLVPYRIIMSSVLALVLLNLLFPILNSII